MNDSLEKAYERVKQLQAGCGEDKEKRQMLKKMLLNVPNRLLQYRLSQDLLDFAKLNREIRIRMTRTAIYQQMTLARFDLLDALLDWMSTEPEETVKELAPVMMSLGVEESRQLLRFLVENATECLPKNERNKKIPAKFNKQSLIRKYYGRVTDQAKYCYDICLDEMIKRYRMKSDGDQLTNTSERSKREWLSLCETESERPKEKFISANVEAFSCVAKMDGRYSLHRKETGLWHQASVKSRLQFFELKFNN